jgi:PAS domain S-box-containing protein
MIQDPAAPNGTTVTAGSDPGSSAQERLLRSVVDSLEGRMCIVGDEGVIVGNNRRWTDFATEMGWGVADSGIGANLFTLLGRIRGELGGPLAAAVRGIIDGTSGAAALKGYLPLVGRGEDVIVRLHPVLGHDNGRAVITIIDISGAVRNEREMRRITDEAQLLALVAQHTDNAVVITDAIGQIEWANAAFCRSSGYSHEELVGLRRHDLIDGPFVTTPTFIEFAEALASGRGGDLQFPSQTKDGSFYWVHVETQPIQEDGETVRFVSVERDITRQRVQDEQTRAAAARAHTRADALDSEKALLSAVLGAIPQLVYWKDAKLRYTGVNQAFLGWRGLASESDVLGNLENGLGRDDELAVALADLEPQVLRTGIAVENRRVRLTSPDNTRRDLLVSVLPRIEAGVISGVIGVAADVTPVSTPGH